MINDQLTALKITLADAYVRLQALEVEQSANIRAMHKKPTDENMDKVHNLLSVVAGARADLETALNAVKSHS